MGWEGEGEGEGEEVWGGGEEGRSLISQLLTLTAVGLLFEVEMQGIPYDQSST